jgi:hypothetical protein
MQLRLGTAPPWPARFCFFLFPSIHVSSPRITERAKSSSFGYSPHRDRSGTAPPRHHGLNHEAWNHAQERAQQHHCCVGLLPATMTDTSITADRPFLQHPYSSLVHFSLNPLKAAQTLRMTTYWACAVIETGLRLARLGAWWFGCGRIRLSFVRGVRSVRLRRGGTNRGPSRFRWRR